MAKYLVGFGRANTYNMKRVFAVLFEEDVEHVVVADSVFGRENVIGAGFYSIGQSEPYEITIHVWGKSVSVGVESREQDAEYIQVALGEKLYRGITESVRVEDHRRFRDQL